MEFRSGPLRFSSTHHMAPVLEDDLAALDVDNVMGITDITSKRSEAQKGASGHLGIFNLAKEFRA